MNKSIERYGEEAYKSMLERQKERRRKTYASDKDARESRLRSASEWKRVNRDKVNISWHNYMARKTASGHHTSKDIERIIQEQGYKCPGCLVSFGPELPFTIDHFVALSKGGSNNEGNIQLLCGPCNYSKQDKTWSDWMAG